MNNHVTENPMTLRLEAVSKMYGDKRVLNELNMEIHAGQVVGYIGPNGAGKTTTIKLMVGLLSEFYGRIEICGLDVRQSAQEVKRHIGYVPEASDVFDALSPLDYFRFIGRIHGLSDSQVDRRAEQLLHTFGLEQHLRTPLKSFSKGMKQKTLIAASVIHDPSVLILDEPMSGLDANSVILLKNIIKSMSLAGKTIFYSSHLLDVVERICDHIIVLDGGQIVASGSLEAVRSHTPDQSLEGVFTRLTSDAENQRSANQFVEAMAL